MKYLLLALPFLLISVVVKGQFKETGLQYQHEILPSANSEAASDSVLSISHMPEMNLSIQSPTLFGNKENRYTTLLGGYATVESESGIHLEVARIIQPHGFGFGAYTSYIRIPKVNYSNWTIAGLQFRAGAKEGEIKPYGVFDLGLFNLTYNNEDLTFRTGTVDLGGGIEKPIGEKSSFLLDFRWKRFFDYKAERDGFSMWTINAGIKF